MESHHETTGWRHPLLIPLVHAAGLGAFFLFPAVRAHPVLAPTFGGAIAVILAWTAWLWLRRRGDGRPLTVQPFLRRPHWIQGLAQGTVLLYWGWWVRPVYEYAPLILAQLFVAFAVDALLSWTRYRNYRLGIGPVPVVFSINLFLWFEVPWFYWQLAMVALVFFGKEFIRREWKGRDIHVFNPSAFALAVASVGLILTSSTEITQGVAIANTQYIPPHVFIAIFAASLPGQALFGVATMTMSAVVAMVLFGDVYLAMTGAYFFYDAYVPIAVFLGMHLLFTDPATSPRSDAGRILWGVFYAAGVLASVPLLEAVGAPTFYDKLLPVPILNLLAPRLDAWATGVAERVKVLNPLATPPGQRRALITTGVWILVFSAFYATDRLGDDHPGQYLPFWEEACVEGNPRACDYLAVMQQNFCDRGSGWACNEFGIFRARRDGSVQGALAEFGRACELGYQAGCENGRRLLAGQPGLRAGPVPDAELPIVLRGSKGPVEAASLAALYELACERGWDEVCARGGGTGA